MSKKLTSLKVNNRRQRPDQLPNKTAPAITEADNQGSQLVGLQSEKQLKIDSGLVNLKTGEHRFNKRSSV